MSKYYKLSTYSKVSKYPKVSKSFKLGSQQYMQSCSIEASFFNIKAATSHRVLHLTSYSVVCVCCLSPILCDVVVPKTSKTQDV